MLILAILFTLVLAAAFAVVPARLGRRKPTRADGCCALLPAVLVWLWAACIWSKPGLTIGFDAFRCLGITAMVLWACGLAAGFRHASVHKWTAAALLLAASLGAEVFIGNLNFWATHSYEPVDLRAYLQEAEDDHNALTLDDEHTTLTFTGLDRELYNLQLSGLEYVYNGPHPEVQNPLFILNVAATDEATSASRQSWNWEVAANAPRSQVRSLDLSGKASILTLTAYPYNGEYRQYPISYTLQTIYANVPRAFDFSLVRWAAFWRCCPPPTHCARFLLPGGMPTLRTAKSTAPLSCWYRSYWVRRRSLRRLPTASTPVSPPAFTTRPIGTAAAASTSPYISTIGPAMPPPSMVPWPTAC